jgi:hypothetical protein
MVYTIRINWFLDFIHHLILKKEHTFNVASETEHNYLAHHTSRSLNHKPYSSYTEMSWECF